MNIAEMLNQFVIASKGLEKFSLLRRITFYIDDDKLSQEDMDWLIPWFKNSGGKLVREFHKSFFKGGDDSYSYDLVFENVVFSVGRKTILAESKKRRNKGIEVIAEAVAKQIISKCDNERIARKRAMGRTYFFEDGSLLKHAIEVMGEPKEK